MKGVLEGPAWTSYLDNPLSSLLSSSQQYNRMFTFFLCIPTLSFVTVAKNTPRLTTQPNLYGLEGTLHLRLPHRNCPFQLLHFFLASSILLITSSLQYSFEKKLIILLSLGLFILHHAFLLHSSIVCYRHPLVSSSNPRLLHSPAITSSALARTPRY